MSCCNNTQVSNDLALRNLSVNGSTSTCRLCSKTIETGEIIAPQGIIEDLISDTITADTIIVNNLTVINAQQCRNVLPGLNTLQTAIDDLGASGQPGNPVTFFLCGGVYSGNVTVLRQGINFIGENAIVNGTVTIDINSTAAQLSFFNALNKFSGITFNQSSIEAVNISGSGFGEVVFDNCNIVVDSPAGSAVILAGGGVFNRVQFNNCRIMNIDSATLSEIGTAVTASGSMGLLMFGGILQARVCLELDTNGIDSFVNNTMFLGRTTAIADYIVRIQNTSENYFNNCYFNSLGPGSGFNLQGGRMRVSASTFEMSASNSGAGNLPKAIYSSNNTGDVTYTTSVSFFSGNNEIASTGLIAVATITATGNLITV